MATARKELKAFVSGVHNLLPDEIIPNDAASGALNWRTKDGRIELIEGRALYGSAGEVGKIYGEHTGFRVDGTAVRFRKANGAIQYFDGADWVDVITGLEENDCTFANYQSLAGAFVYVFDLSGIYKICTANPADYASLYVEGTNFKGMGLIDKGRTILWGREDDPTGLYGSHIDPQDGDVYTTVSNEAIGSLGSTNYTGTLAFKAGGATRTCFGVSIDATVAAGTETFTDDFNGNLTSNFGGTGTINYMTGEYDITFSDTTTGAVTGDYQWEDSNSGGVTDFTKSAPRVAAEGFMLRQDEGGDPIRVVLPFDGSYYSLKSHSCYKLTLDAEDVAPINEVYRKDIGVLTLRSATATGKGIVFINTANASKPILQILQRNPLGDNIEAFQLFPQFAFERYSYDDACLFAWDQYVVVGCRGDSQANDRLLLCSPAQNTVDITSYGIRAATQLNGTLHGGDPVSATTYELFTGTDDVGEVITNYWEGNGEKYGSEVLKKVKRLRIKGRIDPAQSIQVYASLDSDDFELLGTILGTGDYLDANTDISIGDSAAGASGITPMGAGVVGTEMLGGGTEIGGGGYNDAFPFFIEIKLHITRFRKRKLSFVATGVGYCSIDRIEDFDIWTYTDRIPKKYRIKQNVALAGEPVDMSNPDY